MQLFVREVFVWFTSHSPFPQTVPTDDAKKSPMSHIVLHARNNTCITKRKDITENTSVVPAKISFEGQVRIFSQLLSARAGINYAYLFSEVFWVFIVA